MEATFLTVDDQPLSLGQALNYLQSTGKLKNFIGDILRQYVLEQELNNRDDLDITSAVIEQAVIDFRLSRQLTDPNAFSEWLASNGTNHTAFHAQITSGIKQAKLKNAIAEPKLSEYFIGRKLFLDRIVLSRLVVDRKELAEELKSQIIEGEASFEQLAKEYSITDDRLVNGMMGPISRGTLPDTLRAIIDATGTGEIAGPVELEDRWGLFRVEQVLPATLDDNQLKTALIDELFEQWLTQKIQKLTVKLQVG